MREHRATRSKVQVEMLEDRAVPSLFGILHSILGGGGQGSSVQSQDAQMVQQAFSQFESTYGQDIRTILYGADSSGNINPANNRAAFDSAVATALGTLSTSVTADVSNLTANSANATLATTISTDLPAPSSTPTAASLQGQLQALATPMGVFNSSARMFQNSAGMTINSVENAILQQVHNATTSTTSGGSGGSTSGSTSLFKALPATQQAIATFASNYINDVKNVLFKADSSGNINPANNRAAFNTQVATDLTTLDTSVDQAVTANGGTSTLTAKIDATILGTGADSLQGQLTNLTTPTGPFNLSALIFLVDSSVSIQAASQTINSDIVTSASSSSSTGTGTTPMGHGFGRFGHFFFPRGFRRF